MSIAPPMPLRAGAGSREFRQAVSEAWLPALERFRPELIFFSAGFDAHVEDDMAMLRFADADYGWVTEQLAPAGMLFTVNGVLTLIWPLPLIVGFVHCQATSNLVLLSPVKPDLSVMAFLISSEPVWKRFVTVQVTLSLSCSVTLPSVTATLPPASFTQTQGPSCT